MLTKFTKISQKDGIPSWNNFFRAGDAWLESLQILEDNKDQMSWGVFYTKPWIVAFCLELFVKAIASHVNPAFKGIDTRHKTIIILEQYKNEVPIFKKILNNNKLRKLIVEYENTKDSKYGETYVSVNGDHQDTIIETIYELRKEICKRTGLR